MNKLVIFCFFPLLPVTLKSPKLNLAKCNMAVHILQVAFSNFLPWIYFLSLIFYHMLQVSVS